MSSRQNKSTMYKLVMMASTMLMLSFAAVPFYDWFCRVTGFGGQTLVANESTGEVLDRTIEVRFDGSLHRDMDWEFAPIVRTMDIKIGEDGLAFYEAYNPTDRVIAGTASYNVYPYTAGQYFNKVQCFCFELQVLQPGERVQMPVSFFVDPEIARDRETQYINSITLSYTFHVSDLPEDELALVSDPEPNYDDTNTIVRN